MLRELVNPLLQKLRSGGFVTVGGCSIVNGYSIELMSSMGFDGIMIDMQHSDLSYATLADAVRAIRAQSASPVVRVLENSGSEIGRVLDSGALNIVCPMINTGEDCRRFVESCYYAPIGRRSWGPMVGATGLGITAATYFRDADSEVLPIAMIETVEGLANAADIISTPGLGGLYVGTSDLSIELGVGFIPDLANDQLFNAVGAILEQGRKHSVPVGAYLPTIEGTDQLRRMGGQILWLGSDHAYIRAGAQSAMKTFDMLHSDNQAAPGRAEVR